MEREHWMFSSESCLSHKKFFPCISSIYGLRDSPPYNPQEHLIPTFACMKTGFSQCYVGVAHGWPWAFFCCSDVGYRDLNAPWHGPRGHPCSKSSEGKLGPLRLTMQGWSCLLLAMQVQHSFKSKATAWKESMLFFYRSMEPLLPLEKKEKTRLGGIET